MTNPTLALDGSQIIVTAGHRRLAFTNLAEAVRLLPPRQADQLLRAIEHHLRSTLPMKRQAR